MKVLVTQSCLTLCDPVDCHPPGSSVHGDSPGKNIGMGGHSLPQGISTQELNLNLLLCSQIVSYLSHQGSHTCTPPCFWTSFPSGPSTGIK